MRLSLETDKLIYHFGEPVVVRLIALNDQYQPGDLDRQALVGPNPVVEHPSGMPLPVSLEPSLEPGERDVTRLNAFSFYGRERVFDHLPPGKATFHAYLLSTHSDRLLPEGPLDPALLGSVAAPITVTIEAPATGK